uniref:ATPase BadF/BadG/BcrA/BcrD type domain-containing protein n=1 Tax=Ignisphaera aggregans TaxID=334771 RepID=A0A7C5XKZ1_9CREN
MVIIMKFIALDIGKTKTIAMMFDDGLNVLCSTSSGPADITLDEDVIKRNINKAIDKCLKISNTDFDGVDFIVFSWAGLDTSKDFEIAWSYIKSLGYPLNKIIIEHDAVTAFYAVTWGEPGVAVIAGTGAIAFGMDRKGKRARSSGWGWIIGDEGSASWIALQALNAASKAYDGRGPYTTLVERIKQFYGVKDLLEVVTFIYRMKPFDIGKIAAIATIVDEEAEKGDEISKEIMARASEELALAVYNVAQKLDMLNEGIIVGGVGSVFNSKIVKNMFYERIKKMLPKAILKEPIIGYKAILGPIIIALKKLNVAIDRNVVEKVMNRVEEAENITVVV